MPLASEKPQLKWRSALKVWDSDRFRQDSSPEAPRLDFHQASSHLSQKGPGFYLILLRNEIKHRSLRSKPSLLV